MVPISTVWQWDAFLAAMPSWVTSSSCSVWCTVSAQYACWAATIVFPGYYGASLLIPVWNTAANWASILNYPYACNCDSCGANCSTCYDTMQCVNWVAIYNWVTSCTPVSACTLPWWWTINHWSSVVAYAESTSLTCQSEIRTCNNWVLSWSYAFSACVNGSTCSCTYYEDFWTYDCNEDSYIATSSSLGTCQYAKNNLYVWCLFEPVAGEFRYISSYSDNWNCSNYYSYPLYVDRELAEWYYVILSSNPSYPLWCNTVGLLNANTHCIAGFPNTDGLSTIYFSPYSTAGQSFTSLWWLNWWYLSPTLDAAIPYLSKIKYDAGWYAIANWPNWEDSRYLPSWEFNWWLATTSRLIFKQY